MHFFASLRSLGVLSVGACLAAAPASAQPVRRLALGNPIAGIAFSPGGRRLAAVDAEGCAAGGRASDTEQVGHWWAHPLGSDRL